MRAGSGVRLATDILVVAAFVVIWWLIEPSVSGRLLALTVSAGYLVGIAGTHGRPRGTSRLPTAAQGLVVGVVLGFAIAVAVFAETHGSVAGLLFLALLLPTVHPAVLPGRWRRALTTRWSDLATEPDPATGRQPGGDRHG